MLTIPNYRITRLLGEGAMGQVFEATAERFGCRVAIKVLRAEHSRDPEAVARLFNEARAANVIGHPSIVRALDFGHSTDGAAYLVLEFLEGESLRTQLQRGPLHDRAIKVARMIASAMVAAHECGVVHRDLKPDNLFMVHDSEVPGGERVKVLDFGLAKLAPTLQRDEDRRYATQCGAILGTPAYMAPEQCRGTGNIGAAADVYALGAVLFHMRTGEPPFVAEGVGALIAKHIYEAPPALQDRDPLAPDALARLVAEMLRKDPQARPSMREVAAQLDALANPAEIPTTRSHGSSLTGGQRLSLQAGQGWSRWLLPVTALVGVAGALLYLRPRGAEPTLVAPPTQWRPTDGERSAAAAPVFDLGVLVDTSAGQDAAASPPSPTPPPGSSTAESTTVHLAPATSPTQAAENRNGKRQPSQNSIKERRKDLTNDDIRYVP